MYKNFVLLWPDDAMKQDKNKLKASVKNKYLLLLVFTTRVVHIPQRKWAQIAKHH